MNLWPGAAQGTCDVGRGNNGDPRRCRRRPRGAGPHPVTSAWKSAALAAISSILLFKRAIFVGRACGLRFLLGGRISSSRPRRRELRGGGRRLRLRRLTSATRVASAHRSGAPAGGFGIDRRQAGARSAWRRAPRASASSGRIASAGGMSCCSRSRMASSLVTEIRSRSNPAVSSAFCFLQALDLVVERRSSPAPDFRFCAAVAISFCRRPAASCGKLVAFLLGVGRAPACRWRSRP